MRIDIHHHFDGDRSALEAIHRKLDQILNRETIIMSELTDALDKIEASAAANSAADDAAEQLLKQLSEQIAALKTQTTDPATVARITALADNLNARAAQLGAAVVANTPSA